MSKSEPGEVRDGRIWVPYPADEVLAANDQVVRDHREANVVGVSRDGAADDGSAHLGTGLLAEPKSKLEPLGEPAYHIIGEMGAQVEAVRRYGILSAGLG